MIDKSLNEYTQTICSYNYRFLGYEDIEQCETLLRPQLELTEYGKIQLFCTSFEDIEDCPYFREKRSRLIIHLLGYNAGLNHYSEETMSRYDAEMSRLIIHLLGYNAGLNHYSE